MTVKIKADIPARSGVTFKGQFLSDEGMTPIHALVEK